ncbi:MAG: GlsB/YeaQ/YmgE family stress response membrane protein [Saprospiraceae bacterium]
MEWWIYTIIIGAIAGWLAGKLMTGGGFGLLGNIILGILGGFVGYWIFGKMGWGMGGGVLGSILIAFVGAAVILFIANLFARRR